MSEKIKDHLEEVDSASSLSAEKYNFNPDRARELSKLNSKESISEVGKDDAEKIEVARSEVEEAYAAKKTEGEQNLERYTELLDDIVGEDFGNVDDSTAHKGLAHTVIARECGRRLEEAKNLERKQAALAKLQELENSHAKKSFFGKLFGKEDYEDQRESLERLMRISERAEQSNQRAKQETARDLATYYGEPIDLGDGATDVTKMRQQREAFFGAEGSERAQKVNEAIDAFGKSDVIAMNKWQDKSLRKESK